MTRLLILLITCARRRLSREENPRVVRFSVMFLAPTLLVMTMMVFLKSTRRPCESVSRPSSMICSRILNTSSCAFSISSNRMTLYGLRRTFSVS